MSVILPDAGEGRLSIPADVNAPLTLCFTMQVPNDPTYLEHLFGTLQELTSGWNFANDSNYLARAVANHWLDALSTAQITAGACGGNLQLRECVTGCGIEYSIDGVTWTCINLSGCIADIVTDGIGNAIADGELGKGTIQTGPQGPPPAGGCTTYHVRLLPGAKWHCPSAVKGLDTVSVTNSNGGWSIGELAWYCPDGSRFLLGACDASLRTHVTGDPLNPGAYHMALIGNFNAVYFDPMNSVYQIPAGTGLTDLFIQANTNLTGVPSGEVEFDVTVCNNGWYHYFDLTQSNQNFTAYNSGSWQYVAGQGVPNNAHVNTYYRCAGYRPFQMVTGCQVVQLTLYFTGALSATYTRRLKVADNTTGTNQQGIEDTVVRISPMATNALTYTRNGTAYILILLDSQVQNNNYLVGVAIQGVGPEPTW